MFERLNPENSACRGKNASPWLALKTRIPPLSRTRVLQGRRQNNWHAGLCFIALLLGPAALSSQGSIQILDCRVSSRLITPNLPSSVIDIVSSSGGLILGVVNTSSGPSTDPLDQIVFSVNAVDGTVSVLGRIEFMNPESSDLYRIDAGPGGAFGSKFYITDWIASGYGGGLARADRLNADLSSPEVIYADSPGLHTPTSNIEFSSAGVFGEFAYLGAQVSGYPEYASIMRFNSVVPNTPAVWATVPTVRDYRGFAFGVGQGWGTDLYAACSTELNGFDDAPGQIRIFNADAQGEFAGSQVFISEESDSLEFGVNILFDRVGTFDHELIYLQADGLLLRVDTLAGVTPLASGVKAVTQLATGELVVVEGQSMYTIGRPEPTFSSSEMAATQFVPGALPDQLTALNTNPPPPNSPDWSPLELDQRHADLHQRSSFTCGVNNLGEIFDFGPAAVVLPSPPADVRNNGRTSNTEIAVFAERVAEHVSNTIEVDFAEPGLYNMNNPPPSAQPTVSEGRLLTSHLIHFDTVDSASEELQGWVIFDTEVIGVAFLGQTLNDSDDELGVVGTLYPSGTARAWEIGGPDGWIELSSNRRRLDFRARVHTALDQIRVLTEAGPADPLDEPFVDAFDYIDGADEVSLSNCESAWYRFTFDLPANFANAYLSGVANVDQFGVAYLNGYRLTAEILASDPDNLGIDRTDAEGLSLLSSPTRDWFSTPCGDDSMFLPIENELIFGVLHTGPSPTGLEFEATVSFDYLLGDMNCDGHVDGRDIAPFTLAILDAAAYEATYPDCGIDYGDVNLDGSVDELDISGFVALLLE